MSFVSLNEKKNNLSNRNCIPSFNGTTFKTEASSKFPHLNVMALGSYRNLPFVTGHNSPTNGLKTEIFNYGSGEWELTHDYPFSNGNRYVSKDFMERSDFS